jgi:hypothetical protein
VQLKDGLQVVRAPDPNRRRLDAAGLRSTAFRKVAALSLFRCARRVVGGAIETASSM